MNPRTSTEQNTLRASRTSEAQSSNPVTRGLSHCAPAPDRSAASNPVTRGLSRSRQHADPVIEHAAHAPTCSNQLVAAL